MKTTIITLAIASFFAFTNINSASARENISTTTETENNTKTVTSFNNNSEKYLKGDNKSVIKYDENGNRIERTLYSWDRGEWIPISKYEWSYNSENQLNKVLFVQWNNQTREWNNNMMQTQYFYSLTKGVVTINQEINN